MQDVLGAHSGFTNVVEIILHVPVDEGTYGEKLSEVSPRQVGPSEQNSIVLMKDIVCKFTSLFNWC